MFCGKHLANFQCKSYTELSKTWPFVRRRQRSLIKGCVSFFSAQSYIRLQLFVFDGNPLAILTRAALFFRSSVCNYSLLILTLDCLDTISLRTSTFQVKQVFSCACPNCFERKQSLLSPKQFVVSDDLLVVSGSEQISTNK